MNPMVSTSNANVFIVELKRYGCRPQWAAARTLLQASQIVRRYIDDNDLGSSTWQGGKVKLGKKTVAFVSYNGRVWDSPKYPGQKEITGDALLVEAEG